MYVSLEPPILIGDPHIFIRDLHIFIGDPQIFIGDLHIFIGDPQILVGDPHRVSYENMGSPMKI